MKGYYDRYYRMSNTYYDEAKDLSDWYKLQGLEDYKIEDLMKSFNDSYWGNYLVKED